MAKKPTKLALYLFEQGISQKEFISMIEEKTGKVFCKATISNYMNGKHTKNIQLENASILAKTLEIPLEQLIHLIN